jgi:hypothetical protein
MTIRASKTEHHDGGGVRQTPIFPELRPYLEAALREVENDPAFDPKITPLSKLPVIVRYRDANSNLRTQLLRIVEKAKLTPWPKLFQNLRATRATELADEFPEHVAANWLGHSNKIADKHYRQVTQEHLDRALKRLEPTCKPMQQETEPNERSVTNRNESHDSIGNPIGAELRVGDRGLEPLTSAV